MSLCSGDQIKKNEMGWECGTYGIKGRCIQGFGEADLRDSDHLEDLGVDVRVIVKLILKQWDGEAWPRFIWLRIRKVGGIL
jgi:hypothetical protein